MVGLVDEMTGAGIDATVLYLLPIAFAGWFLDAGGGLALAVASTTAWRAAEVATRTYSAPPPGVVVVNVVLHLVLFSAFALLVGAVRRRGRRESALARTDALTGLLNRRGFLEVARREIARSARTDRPLTVALLDVDGLEAVNASGGHEAGDRLLAGMGTALRAALRAVDASARLDGDEFAVLLPDADAASVQPVLDRMRQVMAQAAVERGAPLTVSLGAATFDRPPLSLDELVHVARRTLREAKVTGRNASRYVRVTGGPTG